MTGYWDRSSPAVGTTRKGCTGLSRWEERAHPRSLKPDEELSSAKMTLESLTETTDVKVESGNAREYSSL
jgi:hypothetical protein